MDKRQWIGAAALSIAAVALWLLGVMWYERTHPQPPAAVAASTTSVAPSATQPATGAAPTISATNPTTNAVVASPVISAGVHAVASTQPSMGLVSLGSGNRDDADYPMQLTLDAQGASVANVVLNHFNGPDDAKKSSKNERTLYRFQQPIEGHPETAVLATRELLIDDKSVDLWNVPWTLESSNAVSATFHVIIDDGEGHHIAQVSKTYTLVKKGDNPSQGYEIAVRQSISNLRKDRSIKVHSVFNGTTSPPVETEQGADRSVVVGFRESATAISIQNHSESDFSTKTPDKDVTWDDKAHFAWVGQASTYFGAIILPGDTPGQADVTAHAAALNPGADSTSDHLLSVTFQTGEVTLAPGKETSLPMSVFFGPKWREVLDTPHYESFPRMYELLLVIKSKMCAWATWDWLIVGLVWLLRLFHGMLRDWGLAIICLVLIVRTLLHPITKRSQMQMLKMGKMTPEVEKLKKKYADQPEVLNREMMKLYKEQSGAILGCLPMFLQTPIWIALWSALQGTFELRQAPFLTFRGHYLTWIHDLAKPDMLIHFSEPIPLYFFGWHLRAINILPVAMAVVTYVNQKYFMPMPIAATPEQEQQQKMQRGMSLLFPLMFYSLPSGLNLYYLTSMSLGIVESKIIRSHIKEQEEIAKAMGPELVSTKPTRGSRGAGGGSAVTTTPKTPPGKPGLMDRVMEAMRKAQEQAEQMKKEQGKGKK